VYTNDQISELILLPKIVTDSPKEVKDSRGAIKRIFELKSTDGLYSFGGFITQNRTFAENFSIGLVYYPKDEKGSFALLRCNGPHGPNNVIPHHEGCHIHTILAEHLNAGIKEAKNVVMTKEYATLDEAIQYYVRAINIDAKDRQKHFPPPSGAQDLFNEVI
jgi:hypothetical protein